MLRLAATSLTLLLCINYVSAEVGIAESAECAQAKATVTRLETELKDWPALARYRADNGKTALPAKTEKRVVFMGDSITDSWDNPQHAAFF